MKKIIKTFGFIFISVTPLVNIAVNCNEVSSTEKIISKITQTFKTKLKTKFNWVTQTKENSNSNINDGRGMIFEDSRGNLWSMGKGIWGPDPLIYIKESKLQKYNYYSKSWVEDETNNIIDGNGMVMFEDSRGNLWSMGRNNSRIHSKSSLQKYDYSTNSWSAGKTNILNGQEGVIFEDSRGNLWAMGSGSSLQKYNYDTQIWISQKDSGNKISIGSEAVMFEDSRKNLWAMGRSSKLQKYDYEFEKWVIINRCNITDGNGGVIFEDSRGNLWVMGKKSKLQKYDYNKNKWSEAVNSNIIDGYGGVIFEDTKGNLWSMGNGTPLQKYDYSTNRWSNASQNSNITDGQKGVIFEDSRGNLWSMGKGTPLQKYHYNTNGTQSWIEETAENSNSNIIDGFGGVIFEDTKGNLWVMGNGTPLQKYVNINDFNTTIRTRINEDGRIAVLIKNYRKYLSDKFTHLQYKKKDESIWKIVKDKIIILDKANYEFKWVIGTDEEIVDDSKIPEKFEIENNGYIKEKVITTNLIKDSFTVIGTNDHGTIIKKPNTLPSQVEPRYYLGTKSIPVNSDFTNVVPVKLKNGDTVKIKFFIKKENINSHKWPSDFLNATIIIAINGLPKGITVATTNLRKESFFITGMNGTGTIKFKKNITLPPQVETKYYVGKNANNNEYKSDIPTKLSNGKTVWIKFFIKKQNINTHNLPNNFDNISIKITGLKNKSSNENNFSKTIRIITVSAAGTVILGLGILIAWITRFKKSNK